MMQKRKTKQIIFILVSVVIVAYAIKLITVDFRSNWQASAMLTGQEIFPEMDVNDIHAVIVRDKTNSTHLKRTGKQWIVEREQGYPADFNRLRELIRQCRETRIIDTRRVFPSDLATLELLDPQQKEKGTGVSIELFDANSRLAGKLILGKLHTAQVDNRFHDGRYVLIPGQESVLIVRELFTGAVTDSKLWTDSTFPRIKMSRRLAKRTGDTLLWELSREKPNTLLKCTFPNVAEGSKHRSEYSSQIEHAMAYAKYVNIHRESDRTDWGFNGEIFEAEDFNGFVYSFELGEKNENDRMPIRLSVRRGENFNASPANVERLAYEILLFKDWVYLLAKATYGPMGTTLEQLFPEAALAPPLEDDPNETFQEEDPAEELKFQE